MLDFLKSILTALDIPVNDFTLGYFFALVVIAITLLCLFLIRIILKIVFRKKRCHNISIKAENGNACISCSAIMAAIKALEKEFSALSINKVNMYSYRNRPFLEVSMDFDASKGGLPSHAEKFKIRVLESLDYLFGIKNIKKVHLHLRHVQLNEVTVPTGEKLLLEPVKAPEKPVEKPILEKPAEKEAIKKGEETKADNSEEKPVSVKIEK